MRAGVSGLRSGRKEVKSMKQAKATLEAKVKAAAALITKHNGSEDWIIECIDMETLDMSDPNFCVAAQGVEDAADYSDAMERLGMDDEEEKIQWAFEAKYNDGKPRNYQPLQRAWKKFLKSKGAK